MRIEHRDPATNLQSRRTSSKKKARTKHLTQTFAVNQQSCEKPDVTRGESPTSERTAYVNSTS